MTDMLHRPGWVPNHTNIENGNEREGPYISWLRDSEGGKAMRHQTGELRSIGRPLVQQWNWSKHVRGLLLRAVVALGVLAFYVSSGSAYAAIGFVQGGYATPQSPQSAVAVTFALAQTAGNLNVVVVGWNDTTAAVTSVTDSIGNIYTQAVGPTKNSGSAGTYALTQSIYYARGI